MLEESTVGRGHGGTLAGIVRAMLRSSLRRHLASATPVVALALATGTLAGCTFFQSAAASQTAGDQQWEQNEELFVGPVDGRLTAPQIEEMVQGYADRYSAVITSACEALHRTTDDPIARQELDRFQTRTISAIFDIATNEDAYTKLLDMIVVVSLTTEVAISQGAITEPFGENAGLLTEPLQRSREEIDAIAAQCLTPRELAELDRLITGWRRDNPAVTNVAFVRFDNFAASRSKDMLASVRNGSGLLAPISDAVDEVTRTRLLAERAFYMAKRAPLLISLEAKSMMSETAAMPEIRKGLSIGDTVAKSADRLSAAVEAMPAQIAGERDAIVGSIERTSGMLQSTLGEYKAAIDRTDQLVNSMKGLSGSGRDLLQSLDSAASTLTQTITAAERVAKLFAAEPRTMSGSDIGPPEKPFDPEVYARMMVDLRGSIEELNKALLQTQTLAAGELWERPAAELDRISRERVDHAATQTRGIIELVFQRSLLLIGLVFVLLVAYRAIAAAMERSARRAQSR